MGKHRSAAERLAEMQAKIQKTQLRMAREELVYTDATIGQLTDALELNKKKQAKFKAVLAKSGPASAQERRRKHEIWLEKIQVAEDEAKANLSTLESEEKNLNAILQRRISELTSAVVAQEAAASNA